MADKQVTINKSTLIPVGLAITAVMTAFYVGASASSANARIDNLESQNEDLNAKYSQSQQVSIQVLQRLTAIETNTTNIQTDVNDIKKKL